MIPPSAGWHARDAQCQAGTLPWVGIWGEACQNLHQRWTLKWKMGNYLQETMVSFTIGLVSIVFHFHDSRSTSHLCRCSVLAAANPVFGNFDPSLDLVGKPWRDPVRGRCNFSKMDSNIAHLRVSRCISNDSSKGSQGDFICVIHLMYEQWDYD